MPFSASQPGLMILGRLIWQEAVSRPGRIMLAIDDAQSFGWLGKKRGWGDAYQA